jgi:hypothetical protein
MDQEVHFPSEEFIKCVYNTTINSANDVHVA